MTIYSSSTIAALKILEALSDQNKKALTLSEIFRKVKEKREDMFFDSNMNPVELMNFLQDIHFVKAHQNGVLAYSITDFGVRSLKKLQETIKIKPEVRA